MIQDMDSNQPAPNRTIRGVQISHSRTMDGWTNVMTGINGRQDKTKYTEFGRAKVFTDEELAQLYMGEGLATRIINVKAQDSIRAWISTPNDKTEKITKELTRIKAPEMFEKALTFARLYRGAIIIIIEKGQKDLSKPLSVTAKEIQSLRVYSAGRISLTESFTNENPTSPYFEEIELYKVRLRSGNSLDIHASRCLVFKGELTPDEGAIETQFKYWGMPVMMPIYKRVANFGSVEQSIVNLLLEFNIGKFTLSGLAQLLASGTPEDIEKIVQRLEIMNLSKSTIKSVILGENEKYERDSANVSGVNELMNQMKEILSAISGYPVSRLWGRSAAGMNATGEGDSRNYYDDISAIQEFKLSPPLTTLINIIGGYLNVTETEFLWNPLWQPTEKEIADTNKLNSEADKNYIETGVLTAEQVNEKRFPDTTYSKAIDLEE